MRGSASESNAAFPVRAATKSQNVVLLANALTIFGTIMGTYYWYPLLPALEADPSMGWTPSITKRAQTVASLAETCGTIFMATLADQFAGSSVLAVNGMFLCCMVVLQICSTGGYSFMLFVTLAALVKGVMWPAICSVTAACMERSKQDTSFLSSALSSRLSDTATPLLLGLLLHAGFAWRQAAASLLVCVTIILTSGYLSFPSDIPEPSAKEELSAKEVFARIVVLMRSVDAWLVWTSGTGCGLIWVLVGFVPLLLTDVYGLTPGTAASSSAYIASGMTFGLLFNVLASSVLSVHSSRGLQVAQGAVAVIALGALTVYPRMPIGSTMLSLVLAGFGAVALTYMPALIYSANSPSSERAFNLGVMYGTTSIVSVGMTYVFGGWREMSLSPGALATRMYATTAAGILLSCITTACYYHKLQAEEECESARQELQAESESRSALEELAAGSSS